MRDTFIAELTRLAQIDPRIFLITGDLGFGVLINYSQTRSHQFLNAGVAEQNMTGLAAGLAQEGRVVFTYSIGNFPTLRCLEQIRNDVAYHDLNVNAVAIGGGFSYGSLGMSHHATEDLAIMRALPGMTVVSPGDLWEVTQATKALADTPGPGYLRLDKMNAGDTSRPGEVFELGKIRTLREGNDVTLAATGGILGSTLEAADLLAEQGIHCRVLSVHTLKPLDADTLLAAARETGGIVTVEEHNIIGGLGGAVAEACLEGGVAPRFFKRIGLNDVFSAIVGSQQYLKDHYGMGCDAVVKKVLELLRK